MKKYFLKISTLFLLSAIFFTASSFCFHGLSGLMFRAEAAHATNIIVSESDACVNEEPVTNNSHNNSALLCCVSDSRPSVISSVSQNFEIVKLIPVSFFDKYEIVKTILISVVYHKPLSSPPELLALRSTVLRI